MPFRKQEEPLIGENKVIKNVGAAFVITDQVSLSVVCH